MNEPLEGVDSFDVLLDPNDSVFDPHPGFQHRFVGLYSMKSDKFCSRLTCRHVDPGKLGLRESFSDSFPFVPWWSQDHGILVRILMHWALGGLTHGGLTHGDLRIMGSLCVY